jgi:hypothetical protein
MEASQGEPDAASVPGATASNTEPSAPLKSIGRILRGDVGFFVESIEQSLSRAREHLDAVGDDKPDRRVAHDVAIISGIALAMMSFKLLKVLPGLPFLPGWKTLFFYPLYILAAHLTYTRWGGTTAGTIMGVLGYMQGDGRYGVFEILKHLVPGLVVDLVWPVLRRGPRSAFLFCVLGFVVAIARTATEFVIMLLAQARLEAYVFVVGTLVSNLVAGTLSGLVTYFVLPAFRGIEPSRGERQSGESARDRSEAGDEPIAGAAGTLDATRSGDPANSTDPRAAPVMATPAGARNTEATHPREEPL